MLGGVLRLCFLHSLIPEIVAIDDIEAVPHLSRPEVKIGHMPGKLMPVKSYELSDLIGQDSGDVGGVGHCEIPWAGVDGVLRLTLQTLTEVR
jgi:hypothetical protein